MVLILLSYMLLNLLFCHLSINRECDWETFFETSPFSFAENIVLIGNDNNQYILTTDSNNYYIKNSYFESLASSEIGGAISAVLNDNCKTLVESTTFCTCSVSKYASGFYQLNGQAVLHKMCGFNCTAESSTDGGLFCRLELTNSNTEKYINSVNISQISHCKNTNYGENVWQKFGDVKFYSSNITYTEAKIRSVCYLLASENFGIKVSYCSFSNNTASDVGCMYLQLYRNYEICSSNLIYNEQKGIKKDYLHHMVSL